MKALGAHLGLELRTLPRRFDQHFGITPNQRAQQQCACEQKGQEIPALSLHSTRLESEYFFGKRQPHLNAKPQYNKALSSKASPSLEFLDRAAKFSATFANFFPCKE